MHGDGRHFSEGRGGAGKRDEIRRKIGKGDKGGIHRRM
jgi:hypothetical protein